VNGARAFSIRDAASAAPIAFFVLGPRRSVERLAFMPSNLVISLNRPLPSGWWAMYSTIDRSRRTAATTCGQTSDWDRFTTRC